MDKRDVRAVGGVDFFEKIREFEVADDSEGGSLLVWTRPSFELRVSLGGAHIEGDEVKLVGVIENSGRYDILYYPAGVFIDEPKKEWCSPVAQAEFFDIISTADETMDKEEVVFTCLTEIKEAGDYLGLDVLSADERYLYGAACYFELTYKHDLVEYSKGSELSEAAEFTREFDEEMSLLFREYAEFKTSRSKLEERIRNIAGSYHPEELYDTCLRVNSLHSEGSVFDAEKFGRMTPIIDREMKRRGYTGDFPKYAKGELYADFGLIRSPYRSEDGTMRLYDVYVSFGDRAKKMCYRGLSTSEKLELGILALCHDDTDTEEKIELYVRSVDMILSGKNPPREFSSDRYITPQLMTPPFYMMGNFAGFIGAFAAIIGGVVYYSYRLCGGLVVAICGAAALILGVVNNKLSKKRFYLKPMRDSERKS